MAAQGDSLHENILRHQNKNVLKKYEVLHVLGTGSMGTVSMVKVKDSKIGGTREYECPSDEYRERETFPPNARPDV